MSQQDGLALLQLTCSQLPLRVPFGGPTRRGVATCRCRASLFGGDERASAFCPPPPASTCVDEGGDGGGRLVE